MRGGKGILKVGLNIEHLCSFSLSLIKKRRKKVDWQTRKQKPTMPLGLVFLSMLSWVCMGGFGSIIVCTFVRLFIT